MPHQCTNCGRTFADGSKEMLSGCPDCAGTKFQFQPDGFGTDGSDADGDGSAGVADSTAGVADDTARNADGTAGNADDGSLSPVAGQATSAASGASAASAASKTETSSTAESSLDSTGRPGDAVSRTVGSAAATVRDLVSGSAGPNATAASPRNESASTTDATPDDAHAGEDADGSGTAADDRRDEADGDDIIVAECEPVDDDEDAAQADARSQLATPDEVPESEGFDPATDSGEDDDRSGVETDAADETPTGDPDEGTDGDLGVDRISVDDAPSETEPTGTTAGESTRASSAEPSADPTAAPSADPSAAPSADPSADRTAVDEPDAERADRPDLAELREELNEQFESIRVVEPGQYELNLMELYDREEYIIALQEDGRYSIQVPETWRDADV